MQIQILTSPKSIIHHNEAGFIPGSRMIQHMQILINTISTKKGKKKTHDHLSRFRKNI